MGLCRQNLQRAWWRVRTLDRILWGANAGDLPGETPAVFELAMNRNAANARLRASWVDIPRGRHCIRCAIAAACERHASPRQRANQADHLSCSLR
jgi:hypothetical protein